MNDFESQKNQIQEEALNKVDQKIHSVQKEHNEQREKMQAEFQLQLKQANALIADLKLQLEQKISQGKLQTTEFKIFKKDSFELKKIKLQIMEKNMIIIQGKKNLEQE